jgi:predicted RNA binding protein YcfA (HicA-like mRNA interferase family)
MPTLPSVSGERVVRAFQRAGWSKDRQHGSHVILIKPGSQASLSVPLHREVAPGTLRSLIRSSGMTVAQFVELLCA